MEFLIMLAALVCLAYLIVVPIIAIVAWRRSSELAQELGTLKRQLESALRRLVALEAVPAANSDAVIAAPEAATQTVDALGEPLPVPRSPALEPVAAAAPAAAFESVPAPVAAQTAVRAESVASPTPPRPVSSAAAKPTSRITSTPAVDRSPNPLSGLISWFMQGNPIAKLGVLLLFFGLAYLFKFAADNNVFPIELRLAGAGALAMALLVVGWRLRVKMPLYGLILQGGAVGALYLVSFAAFRLYALLPHGFVFGLLIVICAASVALAVLQRAQSLAVLASLGGYLAPVLLSTGGGNFVGLFSYYALLSTGILVVSVWQSWRPLNLVGFLFSFGVALAWGLRSYTPDDYLYCQLFLIFNLVLYGVLALASALNRKDGTRGFIDGTLIFGTPLVGFGLQVGITQHWEFGAAFSSLGFAALYLPLAAYLIRRWPQQGQKLALSFLALGAGFVTLAIPLALSAKWTAMAWALEGLGVLWAGRSQQQPRMTWSGSALLVLAAVSGFKAMFEGFTGDGLNTASFLMIFATLSLTWLAAAYLWRDEADEGEDKFSRSATSLFLIGGVFFWLMFVGDGSERLMGYGEPADLLGLGVFALGALAWHQLGARLNWVALRHCAWLLWPVMWFVFSNQVEQDERALNDGLWSAAWGVALAAALYLLRNAAESLSPRLRIALHATFMWLILAIAASEAMYWIDQIAYDSNSIEWRMALSMLGFAATILMVWQLDRRDVWPVAAQPQAYWLWGLAPLLPVALLFLFGSNFLDGVLPNASVLPGYIPLLNPLEQSAGFCLLMLGLWQREAVEHWPAMPAKLAKYVLWALALWWLNGLVLRSLSSLGDIPWDWDDLWASRLVQTSFALLWTLAALGAMHIAARRANRNIWFGGAALLGIVIAKLFLVDSAQGGGLARAISFIGVSLMILVIGYLAPIPPKHANTALEEDAA